MMPSAAAGLGRAALGGMHIPASCWDVPMFKECHSGCWHQSRDQCRFNVDPEAFGGMDECIASLTEQCSVALCVPDYCAGDMPPQSPDTTLPCTDYRVIKKIQRTIGANPDGAWGPLSQAAYEAHVAATGQRYKDIVTGCTGSSPATEPVSARPPALPRPAPPPVVPPLVPLAFKPAKKPALTKANMLVGGAVVAVLGVGGYIYAKKKGLVG